MNKKDFKIDFIGVGVERSGTTWLFECLRDHPQVCVSKYKETDFFKDDNKYNKGIDFYKSFFSHCSKEKITGEFSPWYFFAYNAPERINKHFPNVKIIIIFRNPIDKTYSLYHMKNSYKSLLHKNFEEFIRDKNYISRGFYSERLELFYNLFPRENIKVLLYEDLKAKPKQFIKDVYRFLGVADDYIPYILDKIHNAPEARHWHKRLATTILSKIKRKFLLKFKLGNSFVHYVQTKGFYGSLERYLASGDKKIIKRPPMRPETRKYLQKLFAQDICKLEKLINRDLNFWQ